MATATHTELESLFTDKEKRLQEEMTTLKLSFVSQIEKLSNKMKEEKASII